MSREERISLTAPHGVDPGKVPGGEPELTADDIAGAMGMGKLSRLQSDLLLYKYADAGSVSIVYASLMFYLQQERPEWFEGRVADIARAAIVESVGHNRCPSCNGVPEMVVDEKVVQCHQCLGSGFWYDEHEFEPPWKERHETLLRILRMLEQSALDAMR